MVIETSMKKSDSDVRVLLFTYFNFVWFFSQYTKWNEWDGIGKIFYSAQTYIHPMLDIIAHSR